MSKSSDHVFDAAKAYGVTMTVREWQLIDATMDNHVDSAIMNGDPQGVAQLGESIRRAGWDQATDASRAWRPEGEVITITLTGQQWNLVTAALSHWAEVSDRMGNREDSQVDRQLRSLIESQAPSR